MGRALLVIDVQKGMFTGPKPHDGEGVVARIAGLIEKTRRAKHPIVFIQHAGPSGDLLGPESPGFPFHDALAPLATDTVVVKRNSSGFHDTGLQQLLEAMNVDHLLVTGMQSQMCVDSTIRGAVERGYRVTLVSDGHSTFATSQLTAAQVVAHQNETLAEFARVVPAAAISFD